MYEYHVDTAILFIQGTVDAVPLARLIVMVRVLIKYYIRTLRFL